MAALAAAVQVLRDAVRAYTSKTRLAATRRTPAPPSKPSSYLKPTASSALSDRLKKPHAPSSSASVESRRSQAKPPGHSTEAEREGCNKENNGRAGHAPPAVVSDKPDAAPDKADSRVEKEEGELVHRCLQAIDAMAAPFNA